MGLRRRSSVIAAIGVLVSVILVAASGAAFRAVAAFPLLQFPTDSVVVISDPPPQDLEGQFSEATLLQGDPLDPGGSLAWRLPIYDDSGWFASYPAAMLPGWGAPLGDVGLGADFIWGGPPGTDVGGRYEIPSSPDPQFLFLRKNFCIPINADANSIQVITPLRIQIAATPGDAVISYNGVEVGSLPGREDGFIYTPPNWAAAVAAARRLGRNTLAMNVYNEVDDAYAAVAYRADFGYGIDPAAITVHWNIPSGVALPGVQILFSQGGTGAGGDGPHTYAWDFGDGSPFSADPAPVKVYAAAGTYTVTLTMTDRFGCPSAPVSAQLVVANPTATPTPTNTPPPTDTPLPTDTPVPSPTNTPRPRNGSAPSAPTSTPSILPTATPTLIVPILLPETGHRYQVVWVYLAIPAAGAVLAIACYLLHRRRATRRDA
jgi:hypothetical protein